VTHVMDEAYEIAADFAEAAEPSGEDLEARIRALIAKVRLNERRKRDDEWTRALWPIDPTGEAEPLDPQSGAKWYQEQVQWSIELELRKVAGEVVRPLVDLIHRYAGNGGDWACRVCRPASDILEDGFLCSLHRAESWLASLGEPTAPEGE
jgi:hypothetical protein